MDLKETVTVDGGFCSEDEYTLYLEARTLQLKEELEHKRCVGEALGQLNNFQRQRNAEKLEELAALKKHNLELKNKKMETEREVKQLTNDIEKLRQKVAKLENLLGKD